MRNYLYVLLLAVLAIGCKKYDNVNPNVPVEVHPGVVLPQVQFNISNTLVDQAFELSNELVQYTCSNNSFTEVQRFKILPGNSNPVWNGLYNRLRDLNDIIRMADQSVTFVNYKAIALITKAYIYQTLTDVYGNIPFTEAGKALSDDIVAPVYDQQVEVYKGLVALLQEANGLIDLQTGLPLGGDRIFNGNMLRWKKFANSLHLRILLRSSNTNDLQAAVEIEKLLSNPVAYPLMDTNEDNALFKYSGALPDVFPLSQTRDFDFKYKVVSAFIVDTLKKYGDSRLMQYARPTNATANTVNPQYVGLPNSLPITDAANYNGGFDYQSYLGTRFQSTTEPAVWMSSSEVYFLRAEAVLRGFATGDAKNLYEKGIQTSFAQWGAVMAPNFLEQEGIAYTGSLPQLYLQKFISLFFTGFEGWSDYRRTGYPQLVPGPTNVNDGKIPARIPYPLQEQTLNETNYKQAVAQMGGDDLNTRLWWQP
jgi:hypothetical protein